MGEAMGKMHGECVCSLKPRPSSPRFYLAALEKNRGCEIKSGRGRPGFEASVFAELYQKISQLTSNDVT